MNLPDDENPIWLFLGIVLGIALVALAIGGCTLMAGYADHLSKITP